MIRVGNYFPHATYQGSHIAVPLSAMAGHSLNPLSRDQMVKVRDVYVGSRHVYPEPFRYTLKYRNRLSFTFHGKTYMNRDHAEVIVSGTVEDTVRLDTIQPVFIQAVLLTPPEDYYKPAAEPPSVYSQPPWGRAEQYRDFSGMEFLITPACALFGGVAWGSNREQNYGSNLYQRYMENYAPIDFSRVDGGYRIIIERRVCSSRIYPDYPDEDAYTSSYSLKARSTQYPYIVPNDLSAGYYTNCSTYSYDIGLTEANGDVLDMGFIYRDQFSPGGEGLCLYSNMAHLLDNYTGTGPLCDFLTPGFALSRYYLGFTLAAPMFTGHKHIDSYDSRYNAYRNEIDSWEDPGVALWSHTDMDGSFEILENNNPVFAAIEDYVRRYTPQE